MRSFTSSSEKMSDPKSFGMIVYYLSLTVVLLLLVEGGARFVFERKSKIQRRVASEYEAIISSAGLDVQKKQILFVGNSLLLEGVHFPALQEALSPGIDAKRFVVEDTNYFDWYFGLSRILRSGYSPSSIIVTLAPVHLTSDRVRGEYFAHYLFDLRDASSLVEHVPIEKNKLTSFFFAKLSTFYALRSELRNWIINSLFVDFSKFTSLMMKRPQKVMEMDRIYFLARQRIAELNQLAQSYGTEVVLNLPPLSGEKNQAEFEVIHRAARDAGVEVISAIEPRNIDMTSFSDGFHLNEKGAKQYTEKLISALKTMDKVNVSSSGRRSRPPL